MTLWGYFMSVNLDGSVGGTQGLSVPQPQEQTREQKIAAFKEKYGVTTLDDRGSPKEFVNEQKLAEFLRNPEINAQYRAEQRALFLPVRPNSNAVTEQVKSTQVTSPQVTRPQVKSTQVEKKEQPTTPSGKPLSDKAFSALSLLGKIAVGAGLVVGGTVVGAGLGAAIGAIIGAPTGIGAGPVAAVGAIIGGIIGLGVGSFLVSGLASGFIPELFGLSLPGLAFSS